jgi:hypothetical protein
VWATLLGEALDALPSRFPPGALAALLATGKNENRLRDAIASFLRGQVQAEGYEVSTTYRTSDRGKPEIRDLAVFDRAGNPVVELEAKAMYSFDVIAAPAVFLHDERWHGGDMARLRPAVARGEAGFRTRRPLRGTRLAGLLSHRAHLRSSCLDRSEQRTITCSNQKKRYMYSV